MLKRYTIISVIILLLLTSIAAGNRFKKQNFEANLSEEISIPSASIYVDDDGGADYTKIQDAIDNASDGDVIFVFNGTYYENVLVNKKIKLFGENRDIPLVED